MICLLTADHGQTEYGSVRTSRMSVLPMATAEATAGVLCGRESRNDARDIRVSQKRDSKIIYDTTYRLLKNVTSSSKSDNPVNAQQIIHGRLASTVTNGAG